MSQQNSWICDGEPKNGQSYPNSSGPHSPQENFTPDCVICGLPREAMMAGKTTKVQTNTKTVLSQGTASSGPPLPLLGAIALLILLLGGGGIWFLANPNNANQTSENTEKNDPKQPPSPPNNPSNALTIVSESANNGQLISQGEKILFTAGKNAKQKEAAAEAFTDKNWDEALKLYETAYNADRNDPEAKIYLNNAKAKASGQLLTMAVVAPISQSANEAKEVLRGVAQYQDEFNETGPSQLLEVVIVNEKSSSVAESVAEDLIGSSANILGVLGHGVDSNTRQALTLYEQDKLAALSPTNTAITTDKSGKSTVKTIPLTKSQTLLGTYLQKVGESLAKYAVANAAPAQVAIFANADSTYSRRLSDEVFAAVGKAKGKVVKEIDITTANFTPAQAMKEAKNAGANVAILALSKNKVDQAIAIAQANQNDLLLLGGDELYNPTILVKGGKAIEGLVLAVPWQWQADNPFASQAANLWKGRVSWRTATTYDATQALVIAFTQNPGNRSAIFDQLNQGVTLNKSVTEFNIFKDIPLVKANPGKAGPTGSQYQFDPI